MSELDAVADELYALTPGDFVAARDRHVRTAKAGKDAELAREIGRLRKPTVAAWVVNLLVRRHAEDVDRLLQLGEALREAQSTLSGAELRELNRTRHTVVAALGTQARSLAAQAGQRVSAAVEEEVQQTLNAALADADLADQVRAGRLATALAYEGFGPAPSAAAPSTATKDRSGGQPDKERRETERQEQQRRETERQEQQRREAERRERERRERQRRETARREAAAAVAVAQRQADEARRRADVAERALERAKSALADAERALST